MDLAFLLWSAPKWCASSPPLTMAVAVLPGFSEVPGLEGEPELTAAGIIVDRRNVPNGDPIIITEVVIIVVS